MNKEDFKNVVGEAKTGEIVTIRFFGKITEESTRQFNNEFDYLESCIRPKLIRVLINSEGGSVLHGMTTYSTIQNSTIPTECIIEGMAASMASVLWAAGTKSLMRDFSILMIHNPFLPSSPEAGSTDLVQSFINQIKTIYRKRFGLKTDHVESIMKGDSGKDGTFFDAKSAVKAGIIPAENVIKTSKQLCEKVKNEISDLDDVTALQDVMERITMEFKPDQFDSKQFLDQSTIINQNETHNTTQMAEQKNINPEYTAVTASLGLNENTEIKDVMARITELVNVEAKLTETKQALKDANTVIAGKDATIQNLQKDNGELNSSLEVYRKKEQEEKKNKIEAVIDQAVTEGKILEKDKATWVTMAESNLALVESTLASIPSRDQITKEIAKDPENIQAAAGAVKTAEEKMAEEVHAVVGDKFEFKKLT